MSNVFLNWLWIARLDVVKINKNSLKIEEDEVYDNISLEDLVEGSMH